MRIAAHHRPPTTATHHLLPDQRLSATSMAPYIKTQADGTVWLPDADASRVIHWGIEPDRDPADLLLVGEIIARRLRQAPEENARFLTARRWVEALHQVLDEGPAGFRACRKAMRLRDVPAARAVNVSVLLGGLSRQRGMARESCIQLALAGLCLDIGATLLPDNATDAMRRRHPLLGADLLAVHTENTLICAAVAGHHERMDGTGHPVRARPSLAARLAGLCDRAVDALSAPMIGPRVPPYLAMEHLADDGGAHDPRLLTELVRLLARRDTVWRQTTNQ